MYVYLYVSQYACVYVHTQNICMSECARTGCNTITSNYNSNLHFTEHRLYNVYNKKVLIYYLISLARFIEQKLTKQASRTASASDVQR